ncbi:aldo/keto reductase [Marinobacterium zhoushanense]|uniref:Aldo/keto reductase n=1 Tax=Marinobacterium zhoushanense TaxID=1679163 RepID=A0ABQ1KHM9_9GAMM|nr:aldo/keto reductase [Marinobacterium zhoushanense]GGB94806.1 aldo/keto reductase [Marinobacterium zhoushanense]
MATALNNYFNSPGIGLGCMNLSHAYGLPLAEPEAINALHAAFDMGYRHFDTATLYGGGKNETLLGKALKEKRNSLFLASKCGMAISQESGKKEIDGRPDTLKAQCEASLRRLQTDHIDLYYLHRLDPNVAIEESVGALADLVGEGKIGAIGLSEVSATTLARAQTEHPIAALQTEYSLWSRNAEIAVLEACKNSGTAFVAFSPLARGFLANGLRDISALEPKDIRNNMPRFDADNYPQNLQLLDEYLTLAESAGCTPAQIALAWLQSRGDHVLPIPGTRYVEHMEENLSADTVRLDSDTLAKLDNLINQNTVHGPRYSSAQQAEIDTEEFA